MLSQCKSSAIMAQPMANWYETVVRYQVINRCSFSILTNLTACRYIATPILEVIEVANKARLGLYLKDEEIKRQ
jgi:hypothetical protein